MPASDVLVTAKFRTKITGIERANSIAEVTGVEYINLMGMTGSKPFKGMNIIRTTYSDGTVVISKVVK